MRGDRRSPNLLWPVDPVGCSRDCEMMTPRRPATYSPKRKAWRSPWRRTSSSRIRSVCGQSASTRSRPTTASSVFSALELTGKKSDSIASSNGLRRRPGRDRSTASTPLESGYRLRRPSAVCSTPNRSSRRGPSSSIFSWDETGRRASGRPVADQPHHRSALRPKARLAMSCTPGWATHDCSEFSGGTLRQ